MQRADKASETNLEEQELSLRIEGMHCAACAHRIEKGLRKSYPKAQEIYVSYGNESLFFKGEVAPDDLKHAVEKIGFQAFGEDDEGFEQQENQRYEDSLFKVKIGMLFTIPLFILSMGRDFDLIGQWAHAHWVSWLFFLAATPVQFYVGWTYYTGAVASLKNRMANMDVLIAMGSSAAYFYSVVLILWQIPGHLFFETSAVIITLIRFGKLLEHGAKKRTSTAMKGLLALRVKRARLIQDGEERDVPIQAVEIGNLVLVRPGEKIPVDGKIVDGYASIDEALMTGESLPVEKSAGEEVLGGSINLNGVLTIQVEKSLKESALSQIIDIVRRAQGSETKIQSMADRISSVFVPVVVAIAMATFGIWYFTMSNLEEALVRMISVLVIACPCALGLATPTALVVAFGRAAREGIFFQDGYALEGISRVQRIVFDKTGTLTLGQPTVQQSFVFGAYTEREILGLAASAELASEHPLAKAIIKKAKEENIQLQTARNFTAHIGGGIQAQIGTKATMIGSPSFIRREVPIPDDIDRTIRESQDQGQTVIVMIVDREIAGAFAISDQIKTESKEVITKLKEKNIACYMLTGDNERVAQAIAKKCGITHVVAEVLPQEKAEHVKKLQKDGHIVAVVGDGINDAPALSVADVGIALGTGTDIAMQAAKVALMSGDLRALLKAFELGATTLRTIKQNLFWAFFYNTALIPIAAGTLAVFASLPHFLRYLHPMTAALAMVFSSIFVLANSLRLKTKKI